MGNCSTIYLFLSKYKHSNASHIRETFAVPSARKHPSSHTIMSLILLSSLLVQPQSSLPAADKVLSSLAHFFIDAAIIGICEIIKTCVLAKNREMWRACLYSNYS